MGRHRIRPDPARDPARRRAGRSLRSADPAPRQAGAADAGPRQPAFPAACRVTDAPSPTRHLGQYVRRPSCARATDAGTCWPTTPRSRSGHRLRARDAPRLARSLPEAFGRSRCATCGRSSTVGTIRSPPWAPSDVAQPNMAVLTPGSLSSTYFEHVYLARSLGVPLVEGGDLGGARREVSIKTLAGLRPVHICCAPARFGLRRSARAARRFGARRHRHGRDDAQRQDRARQRARLWPGRGRRR